MGYDIQAIRNKIKAISGEGKKEKKSEDRPKLSFWKPELGITEIRFLPYDDGNGQPFQEIAFYNSKKLTERRVAAPCQWDEEDPVQDLLATLRKDRQNDNVWKLMKHLQTRESYYAPIIVRGREDEGVFIWEMSQKVLNQIYTKLANPDYEDEYLFDPKEGYDFIVTASDSGKEFNGYMVKDILVDVRRKSSPLAKTQKERDEILASIPDVKAYFKSFTPSTEKMDEMVANFLASDEEQTETGYDTNDESDDERESVAKSKIDDAFAGI